MSSPHRFSLPSAYQLFFWTCLALALWVRWRYLGLPLERDEGEYAYIGELILRGQAPYVDAYNMKLPGTYALYALFLWLGGHGVESPHLGLMATNVLTILLIYGLGRRLAGRDVAWMAGGAYALLSLSPTVLGQAGHATHFVTLFAVAGWWLLAAGLDRADSRFHALSGLAFGLAFLMKQPGLLFGLVGLSILLSRQSSAGASATSRAQLTAYCLGLAAPYLAVAVYFSLTRHFWSFWFWTTEYALYYGAGSSDLHPMTLAWNGLGPMLLAGGLTWVWVLSGLGLYVLARRPHDSDSASDPGTRRHLMIGLLVAGVLSVLPGLGFRAHYFIPALPGVALFFGVGICHLGSRVPARLLLPSFLALLGMFAYSQRAYLFQWSSVECSKTIYGPANIFAESLGLADFIRSASQPGDRLAVIGSEPQLYFYTRLPAATGYVYTYALVETHPYAMVMQGDMATQIQNASPEWVVFVNFAESWLPKKQANLGIIDWSLKFLESGYGQVVALRFDAGGDAYRWQTQAPFPTAGGEQWVGVYRRKAEPIGEGTPSGTK